MSSSLLTSNPSLAKAAIERRQKMACAQFTLGLRDPQVPLDSELLDKDDYLNANPDVTEEQRAKYLEEWKSRRTIHPRNDISNFEEQGTLLILTERVDELKQACKIVFPLTSLSNVCFGTLPGGGLDANTFKVPSTDQYGVLIPDGLFNLINLFCKIIVLLQPITVTRGNPVYLPSAAFQQLDLGSHPYIQFRLRDLLRAYFWYGDPGCALPYRKAIPFQDRFSYLLSGTELYILAHEVAHVLLGHLTKDDATLNPKLELKADALALDIVTEHFDQTADYGRARASLCAALFFSINAMWEKAIRRALNKEGIALAPGIHPSPEERFDHLSAQLGGGSEFETPSWYIFVFNAIRMATEDHADAIINDLIVLAGGLRGLSARIFPASQEYYGHFRPVRNDEYWTTIAELLTYNNAFSRRLGLWFFCQFAPACAIGLYRGLLDDENEVKRDLYKKALISIEPMYESYLPRLIQHFRETAKTEQQFEYMLKISMYINAMATIELGEERVDTDPMSPSFFKG